MEEDAGPDETPEAHLPGGSDIQRSFRVSVEAFAAELTGQISDLLPRGGVYRPLFGKNCALRERACQRGWKDSRRSPYRYSLPAGPPNRWRSGALPDMRLICAAFMRSITLSLNLGYAEESAEALFGPSTLEYVVRIAVVHGRDQPHLRGYFHDPAGPELRASLTSPRPSACAYTMFQYTRNQSLGFAAVVCFCTGYTWLIAAATP